MTRPLLVVVGIALLAACAGQPHGNAPPDTPTGLTAVVGNAQVQLDWNANSESDLAQYNVYRGTASGVLDPIASVPSGTETFTDAGLTNGTTYYYAIDAEDVAGKRSAQTAEIAATPTAVDDQPPSVVSVDPPDGTIDVAVNDSISVTFSEPMNRAATEAAFSTAPAIACDFSWTVTSTTLTCRPQADMTPSTTYDVTIAASAEDAAGNALPASFSFSFTTGTDVLDVCTFDDPDSTFGECLFGP